MSVEDVSRAKADLLAAGENLDGKCGAHKIAAQTAWNMRNNGQGWGLVHSTGSGCEINNDIYRADSLMLKDGTTKDILMYAESRDGLVYPEVDHSEYNIPCWNDTGPQAPENWRAPYDPHLLDDGSDGGESGGTTPPADTQAILDAITASESRINAWTTTEADRVIQRINECRQEVIDFAALAGKLLVLRRVLQNKDDDTPQP